MASIDVFLDSTMLAAARAGKLPFRKLTEQASLRYPLKAPGPPPPDIDEDDVPIWNFDAPSLNNGVHVSNLTCRLNSMKCRMTVCDSIDWGPVTISSVDICDNIDLPLTQEYLVRNHFLPSGYIDGKSGLWKLEARTDQSFELVFAYEFPPFTSSAKPRPMAADALDTFADLESLVSLTDLDSSTPNTLRVAGLRVVVVVTLVCGKLRYNFDPSGALGAGRFNPMIMVLSNKELKDVVGTVKISRPARTTMQHEAGPDMSKMHTSGTIFKDGKETTVPMILMDEHEYMLPDIGAILVADRNPAPNPLKLGFWPEWPEWFDYYDLDPPVGQEFVMAHRPKEKPDRVVKDGSGKPIEVELAEQDLDPVLSRASGVRYEKRQVRKVAGQGEFDNIHIAPKMVIPLEGQNLPDVSDASKLKATLGNIAMAPFCVHDCLHLHVRWGEGSDDLWNLGWSNETTPAAKSGAPLVPSNQKITAKLLTRTSVQYKAEVHDVQPLIWQVIMHHGASYALVAGSKADFMRVWRKWTILSAGPQLSTDHARWATAYWNFRWEILCTGYEKGIFAKYDLFERMKLDAELLTKLREAGGVAAKRAAASGT